MVKYLLFKLDLVAFEENFTGIVLFVDDSADLFINDFVRLLRVVLLVATILAVV